jgi:hypothetical protein
VETLFTKCKNHPPAPSFPAEVGIAFGKSRRGAIENIPLFFKEGLGVIYLNN